MTLRFYGQPFDGSSSDFHSPRFAGASAPDKGPLIRYSCEQAVHGKFLIWIEGRVVVSAKERLLPRLTLVILAQLALEAVFELAYISGQSVPSLLDDLAQVTVQLIQSCGDPSVTLLLLSRKL